MQTNNIAPHWRERLARLQRIASPSDPPTLPLIHLDVRTNELLVPPACVAKRGLLALSIRVLLSGCANLRVVRSSRGFAHKQLMRMHVVELTLDNLKLVNKALSVTQN